MISIQLNAFPQWVEGDNLRDHEWHEVCLLQIA
jgi:hypothetical protein